LTAFSLTHEPKYFDGKALFSEIVGCHKGNEDRYDCYFFAHERKCITGIKMKREGGC